jgi:CBS domain-containing protein
LFWNPFLIFIALFVWIGAQQEAGLAQMKSALVNTPMRAVMITDFRTLAPDDTLARAVEYILAGFQQDFPVVERAGQLVGVLTRADLIRALSEAGKSPLVTEVRQREFHTASPFDMAEGILARLQECNCHSLPVVQNGRLVGLLTAENLGEFLMIQGALKGEKPA